MSLRRLLVAAIVVISVIGFISPASAERGDKQVRFGVLTSMPTGDFSDEGQTTELDSAFGFQASFEYGITDLMGVEAGLSSLNHDVTVKEEGFPSLDLGEIDLLTLAVSLNFHVKRTEKMDLFVGPMIGNAFWGDLQTTDLFPEDFPADDEVVFGLNAGIDLPFGEGGWAFSGKLRYTLSDVSLESGPDLGVDPLELGVGLSYSF
jgi:outer membrane protein W